eukprot:CAMPEP_0202706656 /NCGR_PEP_ID=MMETSP1385-20130828/19048_1 /ASSEMBLY_ACC=CAM_ASM_000861 /TAXON_ID=933848 /ORGANISM="Elphidium margaritaceum" /LENGTH=123 /DNA_ID=CAMNT_0049365175 /DNA_START=14 /DNA_END=381 /DNA_ORIENTATION=+
MTGSFSSYHGLFMRHSSSMWTDMILHRQFQCRHASQVHMSFSYAFCPVVNLDGFMLHVSDVNGQPILSEIDIYNLQPLSDATFDANLKRNTNVTTYCDDDHEWSTAQFMNISLGNVSALTTWS